MLINCKLQKDKNIRFWTFSSAFKQFCCDLWKKKSKWAKKSADIFLVPPLHLSLIGSYTYVKSPLWIQLRRVPYEQTRISHAYSAIWQIFCMKNLFSCLISSVSFTKKGQFPRASDLRPRPLIIGTCTRQFKSITRALYYNTSGLAFEWVGSIKYGFGLPVRRLEIIPYVWTK